MGFELREIPPIPVVALQGTEVGKFLFVVAVPAKKDCADIIESLEAHGQICRVEAHPKTIEKVLNGPDEVLPDEPPVGEVPELKLKPVVEKAKEEKPPVKKVPRNVGKKVDKAEKKEEE